MPVLKTGISRIKSEMERISKRRFNNVMPTEAGEERCVVYGKRTGVMADMPIALRRGYIEGAGQLCPFCRAELYGK